MTIILIVIIIGLVVYLFMIKKSKKESISFTYKPFPFECDNLPSSQHYVIVHPDGYARFEVNEREQLERAISSWEKSGVKIWVYRVFSVPILST